MTTREYFFEKLKTLKHTTGLLQFEKMKSEANPEKTINDLIDQFVWVRGRFKFIPEDTFRSIIDYGIIKETELKGLYPNVLYKWVSVWWDGLDIAKKQEYIKYYNIGKKEPENETKPVSDEEAQKYINEMKKIIANIAPPSDSGKLYTRQHKKGVKLEQEIVICDRCKDKEPERNTCGHCNGYGKIKKIIGFI